jgi:hypothetical protein
MPNLTKRTVDASVPTDREYFVWCSSTPGFGLRVHPTGKKVFIAQVRVGQQTRRLSIGHYGPFTVDQARTQAREIIRSARLGSDPQRARREARKAITVAELCEIYMEAARAGLVLTRFRVPKRQSTVKIDEGRVTRHIGPLIGSILAKDLTAPTSSAWSTRLPKAVPRVSIRARSSARPSSKVVGAPPRAPPHCWAASIPGARNGVWSPASTPCAGSRDGPLPAP